MATIADFLAMMGRSLGTMPVMLNENTNLGLSVRGSGGKAERPYGCMPMPVRHVVVQLVAFSNFRKGLPIDERLADDAHAGQP